MDNIDVSHAYQAIVSRPWAMREDALEKMIQIASRNNTDNFEALQQRSGRPMKGTKRITIREVPGGKVAIIPVTGPIFKGANLFTEISGATSNEDLSRDITTALTDPQVQGLVLNIDSPGGTIEGTQEVAHIVYDNRGVKPITAYVDGEAASGAYWIASAADRIVMPRTGIVGSIGVVATVRRQNKQSDVREVVSSASPNKRPDVDTYEGYQELLGTVDDLANEFITDVAQFRGVTEDTVGSDFGRGGMRVGAKAVKAQMADELNNRFEKVLPTVVQRPTGGASVSRESSNLSYKQAVSNPNKNNKKEKPKMPQKERVVHSEAAERKAAIGQITKGFNSQRRQSKSTSPRQKSYRELVTPDENEQAAIQNIRNAFNQKRDK